MNNLLKQILDNNLLIKGKKVIYIKYNEKIIRMLKIFKQFILISSSLVIICIQAFFIICYYLRQEVGIIVDGSAFTHVLSDQHGSPQAFWPVECYSLSKFPLLSVR